MALETLSFLLRNKNLNMNRLKIMNSDPQYDGEVTHISQYTNSSYPASWPQYAFRPNNTSRFKVVDYRSIAHVRKYYPNGLPDPKGIQRMTGVLPPQLQAPLLTEEEAKSKAVKAKTQESWFYHGVLNSSLDRNVYLNHLVARQARAPKERQRGSKGG